MTVIESFEDIYSFMAHFLNSKLFQSQDMNYELRLQILSGFHDSTLDYQS